MIKEFLVIQFSLFQEIKRIFEWVTSLTKAEEDQVNYRGLYNQNLNDDFNCSWPVTELIYPRLSPTKVNIRLIS